MNAQQCIPLYSFEEAIESALQTIFTANNLAAYTSFSPAELSPPRPRPRVEIEFQTGAATGHRNPATEVYRTDCFTGQCSITVITNTSDAESVGDTPTNAGARAHAEYRAVVRYICATVETTLTEDDAGTDTLLPYHSVNRFVDSGTSPTINPETGVLVSQLNYEVHFNIRPAAWPA